MKKRLKFALALLLFVGVSEKMNSQNYYGEDNVRVIVGMNIVDDSYTTKGNLLNSSENWNMVSYPSLIGVSTFLSERFMVEGTYSMNRYEKGKFVNGIKISEKMNYSAFDATVKYNLKSTESESDFLRNFDPFVGLGMGYTKIANEGRITFNYGFGTYIWIDVITDWFTYYNREISQFGLMFQTQGKSSTNQDKYGNQIQHTFGIVCRF